MKTLIIILIVFTQTILFTQVRIAVFPFENMDGNLDKNLWCYDLQDSLIKSLLATEQSGKDFYIVPVDSVENVLAELNIDPSSPQYKSDKWKAAEILGVKKVVLGRFDIKGKKFLVNTYIYDAKYKIADPTNQAKNLFKTEDKLYQTIPVIAKMILPGLK